MKMELLERDGWLLESIGADGTAEPSVGRRRSSSHVEATVNAMGNIMGHVVPALAQGARGEGNVALSAETCFRELVS